MRVLKASEISAISTEPTFRIRHQKTKTSFGSMTFRGDQSNSDFNIKPKKQPYFSKDRIELHERRKIHRFAESNVEYELLNKGEEIPILFEDELFDIKL